MTQRIMIIPAIDLQEGRCVRLTQGRMGTTTVYSEDPVQMARHWAGQGAERLHVVDLDGAFHGRPENQHAIEEIVKSVSIPVQVGGGIRTLEMIKKYMESGIYSVILGSKVVQDPHFYSEAAKAYPGRVMVGIDAKGGRVMVEGWTKDTGQSAIDLARRFSELGAPTIIYTDVERDGMLQGPNFTAISEMVEALDIPVIASGGVSNLSDIRSFTSQKTKKVAGVIIGKALYTGAIKLPEALALSGGTSKC